MKTIILRVNGNIPSLYKSVSGGSTLNGCTPVNLIRRGSRGTCSSGVPLSALNICVGFFDGGGKGISGNPGDGDASSLIWSGKMDKEVSVWTVVVILYGMAILAQGNGLGLTSLDEESSQGLYIYPGSSDKEVGRVD